MNIVLQARRANVWGSPESYFGVDCQDPAKLVGIGAGLQELVKEAVKLMKDLFLPASSQHEALPRRFRRLAAIWKDETAMLSSARDMALHPAYQSIIGLGKDAVPLLLAQLAREPDHWFWALKAITGVDPIPAGDRGNIPRMAKAWVQWGRDEGYDLP